MKLYGSERAPNPRRVNLFLAANGVSDEQLALERININIADNEQAQSHYLAINPLGQIPALRLKNGRVLLESRAICEYLQYAMEQKKIPTAQLFGTHPLERIEVTQFDRQAELELLFPFMYAFQFGHPFWQATKKQLPEFSPLAVERAVAKLPYFNRQLIGCEFLVNNTLSIADLTLYGALDFSRLLKVDLTSYDALYNFYGRMHQRFKHVI